MISRSQLPFAALICIAGIVMLALAHVLSGFAAHAEPHVLWWGNAGLLIATIIYSARSLRVALVLGVFALSMLPFAKGHYDLSAQTLSMIGVVLALYGALLWRQSHGVFSRIGRGVALQRFISAPVFMVLVYSAFLLWCVYLSWYCFDFIPGYDDSIAQYVHGKFIASGHMFEPTPLMRNFFPVPMMVSDGKWYAQYQPLHSALLGIGHVVGAPWIINPLEGALTVLLIYALAKRIFDEPTARLAALLALGSSFMWFMSAEFMNHATALLFTTLLAYSYIETLEADAKKNYWALGAGLSIGAVFLTRPLTAVGIGLPFAVYALIVLRKEWRQHLAPFAIMALAALACVVFDLWYNQQTTGAALLFPTGKYHQSNNVTAMGFGNSWSLSGVLLKTQDEWARLNSRLFDWCLPSGFFVMLFCLLPVENRYARLLLGVVLSHTLVNMGNQFQSNVFGPRYLYEITSAMIILSAAGIMRIPALVETLHLPMPDASALRGMIAFLVLLVIASGEAVHFPSLLRGYATHFFDNRPEFYHEMLDKSEKPALIFVGRTQEAAKIYRWVRFTNPPRAADEVIFALDRGNAIDKRLMALYPGRHVYVEYKGALLPMETQ